VKWLAGGAVLLATCVAQAGNMWNIDFQGDGTGNLPFGQYAGTHTYGPDASGAWNAFNVASLSDVGGQSNSTVNPSLALNDNDGNPSSVVFSIGGQTLGWSRNGGRHRLPAPGLPHSLERLGRGLHATLLDNFRTPKQHQLSVNLFFRLELH